jgi:hypothetical protein
MLSGVGEEVVDQRLHIDGLMLDNGAYPIDGSLDPGRPEDPCGGNNRAQWLREFVRDTGQRTALMVNLWLHRRPPIVAADVVLDGVTSLAPSAAFMSARDRAMYSNGAPSWAIHTSTPCAVENAAAIASALSRDE